MAEKTSGGSSTFAKDLADETFSRRDQFAMHFGAAILMRGQGRTPLALAREVLPFVDTFISQLDGK